MSGGHWEYRQYFMTEVIEDLTKLIIKNGKLKSKKDLEDNLRYDLAYYDKYPEEEDYKRELRKEFIERGYSEEDISTWSSVY